VAGWLSNCTFFKDNSVCNLQYGFVEENKYGTDISVYLNDFHFNLLQIAAKLVTLITFTAARIMVRRT